MAEYTKEEREAKHAANKAADDTWVLIYHTALEHPTWDSLISGPHLVQLIEEVRRANAKIARLKALISSTHRAETETEGS